MTGGEEISSGCFFAPRRNTSRNVSTRHRICHSEQLTATPSQSH